MPNLTQNYKFKKPQPNEFVKPNDFNDNWDVADSMFKGIDDKLGETLSVKGGGTGATTAEDARKNLGAASTKTYTVGVDDEWEYDEDNGGYYMTLAVPGMLETDTPIADIILGSNIYMNKEYLKAWSCITRITTQNNSVTVYANDSAPQIAFIFQMKVVR